MKYKILFKKIVYFFLILVLIINLIIIFQENLHPEKIPSLFKMKIFEMNSDNMTPKLNKGDILLIQDVELEKINEKDIIVYKQGFNWEVNRVTKKVIINNKEYLKTKGDNSNAENSGTIKDELIEGKMIVRLPYLGKIFSKEIVVILILCIGFILVLKDKDNYTEKKRNRRKIN